MHSLRRWLLPLSVVMLVLFLGTSYFSMVRTGLIIEPLLRRLSVSRQAVGYMHITIRWCAHFGEYAILSLILIAGPLRGRPVTVLLVSVAIAGLDEGLQALRPDRTSSIFEVALDSGGAVTVLALGLPRWALPKERKPRR